MPELSEQLGALCCECSDAIEGDDYVTDPNDPDCRLHPECYRQREENEWN